MGLLQPAITRCGRVADLFIPLHVGRDTTLLRVTVPVRAAGPGSHSRHSALGEFLAGHHVAPQKLGICGDGIAGSNCAYVYAIAPKLQASGGACDPNESAACQTISRFSRVVLWCSIVLYTNRFLHSVSVRTDPRS